MALTNDGYKVKRLAELKQEYDRLLVERLGPINTEPDSVIGQLEGIWAEALANIYEQAQDTYHAMYPFSAEGTSLDGAVSYVGITRIGAQPTQVTAVVYGRESTLLKSGAIASDGSKQYRSAQDTVISRANSVDIWLDIDVQVDRKYTININGELLSYVSQADDLLDQIIDGLGLQLDSKRLVYKKQNKQLRITATNGVTPFALSVDDGLRITKIGSPARFIAEEAGRQVLPAEALIEVVTPRSGWDGISNLVAGTTGRERETDTELRQRFESSRQVAGSATLKAIRARLLQEVADVSEVRLFENRTNETSVNGIPPHAMEALVVGGEDQAVAQAIWDYKPAGIETYGVKEVIVRDDNGDGQLICFSRPNSLYAWIKVNVNKLYDEELLPSDVISNIEQAILSYGQGLVIGEDIITQRMIGPIYANTAGIGEVTIEVAVTESDQDTPVYQIENIDIDLRSIVKFDLSRIKVAGL